jgi:hypothetical protein
MSTAFRPLQLILLVDVRVLAIAPIESSVDVDACRPGVYSQASGGRSLRGGLDAAMFQ